jgi:protein-disulfide isomerase
MSLRHHFAVALSASTVVLVGCSKQPPPPQASKRDAPQASLDSASVLRADKARIQGSESAKVWLVMSSDFQCPYCRMFHDDAYKRILTDYVATGKVRIAYWNQPSPMHVHAVVAAEAAMCAALQDKFWEMHDGLFATQDHWASLTEPRPVFDSLATSIHLRMDAWRNCTASHATVAMIDTDHQRARAGGASSTPTFFISAGGRTGIGVIGAASFATFQAALDSALAVAGKGGPTP